MKSCKGMKGRLTAFLAHSGMEQAQFEESAGLSRGFVDRLGGKMTLKALEKITVTYPDLNEEWLRTGQGEMLKNGQQIESVMDSSVVGANIDGDNNQIINNDFTEKMNPQEEFLNLLQKKDEHISELITIISKLTNYGK